jgi:NAD+ synthase
LTKLKLYASQINTTAGDLDGNYQKILSKTKDAEKENCDLVIFCEMAITGYPCEDLWQKKYFLESVNKKISQLAHKTKSYECAILLGAPSIDDKKQSIKNSAVLIEKDEIKKIISKKSIPNYGIFDEKRYFEAAPTLSLIEFRGITLSVLICEDIWDLKNLYLLQERDFDCIIAINSSPYSKDKCYARLSLAQKYCTTLNTPFVYINQVGGQDSIVFDGSSFALNSKGEIVSKLADFAEDFEVIELEKHKLTTSIKNYYSTLNINNFEQELTNHNKHYTACVLGLRDYIYKNNFEKVLLGMSGGVDSALVAAISVDALGPKNVSLYALPSRFNSEVSMTDALGCAKNLCIDLQTISIEKAFSAMLESLEHQAISDLAKENMQARIRGNILMSLSNSSSALLLSTGNKSELATGYATLYGDMCGAFNPIKDLYKTEVYELARWRNEYVPKISVYQKTNLIPDNIISKAPTAELRENQKDSDSLPQYDILDKILFGLIEEQKSVAEVVKSGFDEDLVKKIASIFYKSEYKRKQAAIGVKLSKMSFDKDRRYPITNKFLK